MNGDIRRIVSELDAHIIEIRRLCEEMEKRYGIKIIDVRPAIGYWEKGIQVTRGFVELREGLGNCTDINGGGSHWDFKYNDIEICTVTKCGRRFLKAARRNNRWTKGGEPDGQRSH